MVSYEQEQDPSIFLLQASTVPQRRGVSPCVAPPEVLSAIQIKIVKFSSEISSFETIQKR
jgi:hypothetical protein